MIAAPRRKAPPPPHPKQKAKKASRLRALPTFAQWKLQPGSLQATSFLDEEAAEDAQLFHCGPLEPREARPGSRPLRDEGLFMEATVARAICSVVALAPLLPPSAS